MTQTTRSVYNRTLTIRRILGTDFPVEAVVYKVANHKWIAARICNGIAESCHEFRTKREAINHYGKSPQQ